MKLMLELVPQTAWYSNLRKHMSKKDWTDLSRKVRDNRDRTCEICGWKEGNGKWTECHEVWDYELCEQVGDELKNIQRLVKLECLCPMCHHVKHWGLSCILKRDMAALTRHAMEVNNLTADQWRSHLEYSADMYRARSAFMWVTDVSDYETKIGTKLNINNNINIRLMEL